MRLFSPSHLNFQRVVMSRRFRVLLNPVLLVGLTAMLTAVAVQPGDLGSIDTIRRLQTTRSFWTSAPTVMPGDMGILGKNGQRHYWYGMGQSLLMLPADILARGSVRLISRFREPPWWLMREDTIVSYLTSTLVCTLSILLCFHFLRRMAFTVNQSILGALTLLLGTTFLHYTQNMEENNYLFLLTFAGFYFHYDWYRTGSIRSLLWGSMALGANLLTRLTTGLDLVAAAVFILLCSLYENGRGRAALDRLIEYGKICIPCYAGFFIIDRLYNYDRFGSLLGTYLQIFAQQFAGKASPTPYPWPATSIPGWPWSTPFAVGFLGPLITPGKSIFLFDPLIVLTLILTFCLWKRFPAETKAYVIALVWLLFSYICFYAKYYDWSGDNAWGDRYVTTPVQMLAMISMPLLMRYRVALKSWVLKLGTTIAAASVTIQIASLFFWNSLEVWQLKTLGRPTFVVGLRFVNIVAFALGTTDRWGLSNEYTRVDTSHRMTTPYFFPFLVQRQGTASPGKVTILIAAWICLLAALLGLLSLIAVRVRESESKMSEASGDTG